MDKGLQLLQRGLTPTHEMIANWIIANPGGALREMGAHFGYSISWLSQVTNTDMFRAMMAEKMKDVHAHVLQDVPTMLRGTAVLAIERVTEVLEKTSDADTIIDAFDKVLHRCGYAPQAKPVAGLPTINQQNNVFYLAKEDLANAREALVAAHSQVVKTTLSEEKVVDGALVSATG